MHPQKIFILLLTNSNPGTVNDAKSLHKLAKMNEFHDMYDYTNKDLKPADVVAICTQICEAISKRKLAASGNKEKKSAIVTEEKSDSDEEKNSEMCMVM